jgi:hypothetical protein
MNRSSEKPAGQFSYYPNDAVGACVLCGNDRGAVHFKGRIVCEECIDIVKKMY